MKTLAVLVVAAFLVGPLLAQQPAPPKDPKPAPVDYDKDVKPIFEARCNNCHSGDKPKGKLSLDKPEQVVKGPVKAGMPEKSKLIDVVKKGAEDKKGRMPPKGDA